MGEEFDAYWDEQKRLALEKLSHDEGLNADGLEKVIGDYLFTEKVPMRDDVIEIMDTRPSLKQRATVAERVIEKIKGFIETFIEGVD
ncbi:MAG: hypothetical protein JJ858_15445 [Rhizobiaceae bacterium]|nr:hypothetical protein [Rhizobiaceae bacterium]